MKKRLRLVLKFELINYTKTYIGYFIAKVQQGKTLNILI